MYCLQYYYVRFPADRHSKSENLFPSLSLYMKNIAGTFFSFLVFVQCQVIRTKSVKYMPFSLSLANFANGIVWSIYALIKFDVNILVISKNTNQNFQKLRSVWFLFLKRFSRTIFENKEIVFKNTKNTIVDVLLKLLLLFENTVFFSKTQKY